ncbi:MAG: hypothetical protein ACRELF_10795 [Gemmataceae bacterium]
MMKLILALFAVLFVVGVAAADPRCRHNFAMGKSGLEVNGTSCDRGPLAGVKAICRDGWQSFHVGSGTCSHHGGIAKHVN